MLNLSKNWTETGSDLSELRKLLEKLDESTSYIEVKGRDIALKTCLGYGEDEGEILFSNVTLEPLPGETPEPRGGLTLKVEEGRDEKYLAAFAEQAEDRPPLLMTGEAVYLMRNDAVEEAFFNNCRLRGSYLEIPSPERDKFLLRSFQEDRVSTLIVRKDGDMSKIFSVRSGRYKPLKQKIVADIFDKICEDETLGEKKELSQWSVDHDFTVLYVEFPDLGEYYKETFGLADDIIPGIKIINSGTGRSKLKAMETWRVGSVIFERKPLGKVHRGEWSVTSFVAACKDEIFKSYSRLPERLGDLWGIDFIEANTVTETEAREILDPIVKRALKELKVEEVFAVKTDPSEFFTKTKKAPTKRTEYAAKMTKAITDALVNELVLSGLGVTAYDVAVNIMMLADRIDGIPVSYIQKLKNCTGDAAFLKYETYKKVSKTEEEETEPDITLVG